MTNCPHCHWSYPDDMLMPITGTAPTPPICGLCALAHVNAIHGDRRKRFRGEMAEDFRQRAINWRKKHPDMQPAATGTGR